MSYVLAGNPPPQALPLGHDVALLANGHAMPYTPEEIASQARDECAGQWFASDSEAVSITLTLEQFSELSGQIAYRAATLAIEVTA